MKEEVISLWGASLPVKVLDKEEYKKAFPCTCEKCHDTGMVFWKGEDGYMYSHPCDCQRLKNNLRRGQRSGMDYLLSSYKFSKFKEEKDWQTDIKIKAKEYLLRQNDGKWWYFAGNPGIGKTHICTAISGWLINRGCETRYLLWRKDIPEIKALVNDAAAYKQKVDALINVPVLYIDDWFKGPFTDADINLAYTIINGRYNKEKCRTIISSERPLYAIEKIDPAIAGRIYQRANPFIFYQRSEDWRKRTENEDG